VWRSAGQPAWSCVALFCGDIAFEASLSALGDITMAVPPVTASSLMPESEWSWSVPSDRHLGTGFRYPAPPVASKMPLGTTFGSPPGHAAQYDLGAAPVASSTSAMPFGTTFGSPPVKSAQYDLAAPPMASSTNTMPFGTTFGPPPVKSSQYDFGPTGAAAPQFSASPAQYGSPPSAPKIGQAFNPFDDDGAKSPVPTIDFGAAKPEFTSGPAGSDAPAEDLGGMSIKQLQKLLKERDGVALALEKEVAALKEYQPSAHEERLARLEWEIGNVQPGTVVKLKAPMLKDIQKVLRDQHKEDHLAGLDKMLESMKLAESQVETRLSEEALAHPDFAGIDPHSLVLGHSYMPLDRAAITKAQHEEERARDKHPAVRDLHYAGHMSRRTEEMAVDFVKEGHVLERKNLWPTAYHGDFWLSLDGHSRNEAERQQEANRRMQQDKDAIVQRSFQYDSPGHGEDFYAVDWLGKLKRGDYFEENHTHPRWAGVEKVAKLFVP